MKMNMNLLHTLNFIYEETEGKITISKKRSEVQPYITCNYLKKKMHSMGIIPTVVQKLLHQRKATKKRLKDETNEFKKKVLDGLQLSYKLVANSVYGQTGARTVLFIRISWLRPQPRLDAPEFTMPSGVFKEMRQLEQVDGGTATIPMRWKDVGCSGSSQSYLRRYGFSVYQMV